MYQPTLFLEKTEIEFTNPSEIIKDRRELPPNERRGNVIPVTGNIPIFIPILINRCIIIIPTTPMVISDPKESLTLLKTSNIL